MSQLTAAQLDALRTLQAAYPDAAIAIIGATALALHIDMTWRMSVDLDVLIAVSVDDLDSSRLSRPASMLMQRDCSHSL